MEIFMWTWKMCIVPGNEIHKLIVVLVLKERFGMDPDDLLAQGIVSFLVKIMFFFVFIYLIFFVCNVCLITKLSIHYALIYWDLLTESTAHNILFRCFQY